MGMHSFGSVCIKIEINLNNLCGQIFDKFLMLFFETLYVALCLTSLLVMFQALMASLMSVPWVRAVLPDSFNRPFVTDLVCTELLCTVMNETLVG